VWGIWFLLQYKLFFKKFKKKKFKKIKNAATIGDEYIIADFILKEHRCIKYGKMEHIFCNLVQKININS